MNITAGESIKREVKASSLVNTFVIGVLNTNSIKQIKVLKASPKTKEALTALLSLFKSLFSLYFAVSLLKVRGSPLATAVANTMNIEKAI